MLYELIWIIESKWSNSNEKHFKLAKQYVYMQYRNAAQDHPNHELDF